MRYLYVILYLVIFIFNVNAKTKDDSLVICYDQNIEENSNVLTNAMLYQFFAKQKYVTEEMKSLATDKLRNSNHVGFMNRQTISFSKNIESIFGNRLETGIGRRVVYYMNFNPDAWNLFWHGNKVFEGSTATIDQLDIYGLNYYTVYGQFKKKITHNLELMYGPELYFAYFYINHEVKNSTVYTGEYGESVMADVYYKEEGLAKKFMNPGVGLRFGAKYSKDKLSISMKLSDLGYVKMNEVITRTIDTNIAYTGLSIENALSPQIETGVFTTDSLVDNIFLSTYYKIKKSIMVPARLNFKVRYEWSKKINSELLINYLFVPKYMPYAGFTCGYKLAENANIYLLNSYGGFGNYNLGIGSELKLVNKVETNIGFNGLNSILFPMTNSGMYGWITLKYTI